MSPGPPACLHGKAYENGYGFSYFSYTLSICSCVPFIWAGAISSNWSQQLLLTFVYRQKTKVNRQLPAAVMGLGKVAPGSPVELFVPGHALKC